LQTMHPLAMAGVAAHSDYKNRALDRLRRTSFYVAATTFGDRETALAAAARVKGLHKKVRGTDPVTGQIYDASDPETQLWVHCAEVHSFLCAYRALAEPRMSQADQDRYFAETARVGALLDMPLHTIPQSKGEMRAYFLRMRPKLLVSELSRDAIEFVRKPPITRDLMVVAPLVRLLSQAAIALVPRYLRRLAGIDRSRMIDEAVLAALKPGLYASTLPRVRGLAPLLEFQAHVVGREAVNYAQRAWKT
jgi:uncharacterized protein (DUF2236 family)